MSHAEPADFAAGRGLVRYRLIGDLLVTCGCRVRLPSGDAGACGAALVYRVEVGWVDKADLARRTLTFVPGTRPLYLDEDATPAQLLGIMDALHADLLSQLAGAAGLAVAAANRPRAVLRVPMGVGWEFGTVVLQAGGMPLLSGCAREMARRQVVLSHDRSRY